MSYELSDVLSSETSPLTKTLGCETFLERLKLASKEKSEINEENKYIIKKLCEKSSSREEFDVYQMCAFLSELKNV